MELQVFDYLIAGGGTAGCVLAARLAEDPKVSIGLIEAGPAQPSAWSQVPIACSADDSKTTTSTGQSGLAGRELALRWGQGLGGSSNLGEGLWEVPEANDFATWLDAGLADWDQRNLWAAAQRAEAAPHHDSIMRGAEGRVAITRAGHFDVLSQAFVRAAHRSGLPISDDLSLAQGPAVGRADSPVSSGRRQTARSAYLQPLPPNVTVIDRARVRRLQFIERRAVGLEVVRGQGWLTSFQARREVIVALGALATPSLLMASGLGPAAVLRRYDLPVLQNLAGVGQGLTDSPSLTLALELKDPTLSTGADLRWDRAAWQALLYAARGQGLAAASLWGASARLLPGSQAGLRLDFAPLALSAREPQQANGWASRARLGRWIFGADQRGAPGLSLRLTVSQPQSRGSLAIASPDPEVAARIDPGYLSDGQDMAALETGLRAMGQICQQSPLEPLLVEPQAGVEALTSFSAIQEALKPSHAYRGTCRMGVEDDPLAVLDAGLHPFGTQNLRVVDASVLPPELSAAPLASVIMLAERAAALIRRDWRGA